MGNYIEQRIEALEKTVDELKAQLQLAPEKLYTVAEVADILKVDTATVSFHIRKGNIAALPGKKRYRQITQTALNQYLNKSSKIS